MIYLELQEVGFFELLRGVIIPLLAVFGFELIYRNMMLSISQSSVPEMQEDFQDADGLNEFLMAVVKLGSIRCVLLILIVSFMLMDKASSMYLWSSSFTVYYMANILESLYAQ